MTTSEKYRTGAGAPEPDPTGPGPGHRRVDWTQPATTHLCARRSRRRP